MVSVVLIPLDRFPAARNSEDFAPCTLSAAQRDFGELVSRAALGEPQVLLHGSAPVAVLLPDGPIHRAPSSDPTTAAGAVTAGDAVSPSPRDSLPRRPATLGDAIGTALDSAPASGPPFGLSALDILAGRIQAQR